MILVTGANGPFGRGVAERLLATGHQFAVSVRDPAAAEWLAARGVAVRYGDFDRPETLAAAYAGAATILLNGTNYGAAVAGRAAAQQAAAIHAAEQVGAERIVVTSWQDLDRCPLAFAGNFRTVEQTARAFFASATVLRMTWGMAASVARDVRDAVSTGVLPAPADRAAIAPAATADLARAAADVLVDDRHAGRSYDLTAPDTITWTDLAGLAGDIAGNPVEYRSTDDAEFRNHLVANGFPAEAIDMLLDYYAAFRSGWGSTVTGDLESLLGTKPMPALDAVRVAATA